MKRFILCIFVVLLVSYAFNGCNQEVTDVPNESDVGQSSETLEESEATTQDFQYTVNEDNTVFINKYTGSDKHVVIPSKIEGLPVTLLLGIPHEEYTFLAVEGVFENTEVESVVIPETVIKIGNRAFLNCTSLTTVDITKAANLKTIGSTAFKNCNKLEKFYAKDKLELIDAQAFDGCTSLKEVILPNTVTAIKKSTFRDCTALERINLSSSLVDIEDCAFQNCSSLKTITIPSKVRMINFEGAAFQGNTSLETIIFEDGREEIAGYMCFAIGKSVEIVIPASVKKFSFMTFNIITQSLTPTH